MKTFILDLIFEEVQRNLMVDDSWRETKLEKNTTSSGIYLYINTGENVGSLVVWTSGDLEIQILNSSGDLLSCDTYKINELNELRDFIAVFFNKLKQDNELKF
jgi:hypothetical protein